MAAPRTAEHHTAGAMNTVVRGTVRESVFKKVNKKRDRNVFGQPNSGKKKLISCKNCSKINAKERSTGQRKIFHRKTWKLRENEQLQNVQNMEKFKYLSNKIR